MITRIFGYLLVTLGVILVSTVLIAEAVDPNIDLQNLPYAHPIIDRKRSLQSQVRNDYIRQAKTKCPTENPRPSYFELKARSLELLKAGDAVLAKICMQAAMDIYLNRVGQFGTLPTELPDMQAAQPYLEQARNLAKSLPGAQVPPGVHVDPLFRGGSHLSQLPINPEVGGALIEDEPQKHQKVLGSNVLKREDDTSVLNVLQKGGSSRPSSLPTSAQVPTPSHHANLKADEDDESSGRFWAQSDQPEWRKHHPHEWMEDPHLQVRVATVYSAQLLEQRDKLGSP